MLFVLALACFQLVSGHSWIECSDYNIKSFDELSTFNRELCKGYPRSFKNQLNAGFGVDTGYNHRQSDCRYAYDSSDRIASYQAGQTIFISHPPKNHVADTCTNPYIPSTSFVVKMSSEAEKDTFDIDLKMLGGEHVKGQIDHLGFQRCYKFCENMERAHCLSGWQLPTTITSGRHSFMWRWEFNKDENYTSCFDAMIGGNLQKNLLGSNTTTPTPTSLAPNFSSIIPEVITETMAPNETSWATYLLNITGLLELKEK